MLRDVAADLLDGLVGEIRRIGSHVSDETHCRAADIDAFVELLGRAHGALRGHAELAHRLLLQRRGDERRRWIAQLGLALDFDYSTAAFGVLDQIVYHRLLLRFGGDRELLDLLALVLS